MATANNIILADLKDRLAAFNCELLEDETEGGASFYVLD